ncbi:MAG: hypothetical protein KJ023_02095 [Burkholderiaceae bacterium]|nr:hypothetical protein [Burkholderiaceae bacterium]
MPFLIAKILVLLLLAAAFGAWLGAWLLRRRYVDVTSEHTLLRDEWRLWRGQVDQRLATPPDGSALAERLAAIEAAVRGIQVPPAPPPTDLAPVLEAVQGIRLPAPERVDLGPVLEAVGAIRVPPAQAVDLAPLTERLAALEQRLGALRFPEPPPPPSLQPMQVALQALETRVAGRDARFAALKWPEPPPPADLRPAPPPAAPPLAVRAGSRNLLARAAHGKPDDLKLIKGVAEVLEKMLHDIGVYYFWQIAEWDNADIAHADSLLTAFKGRIERDEWVAQSRQFVREGVALKPGAG